MTTGRWAATGGILVDVFCENLKGTEETVMQWKRQPHGLRPLVSS